MSMQTVDLRAAALEAVRLLDHETSPASHQARQLLIGAFQAELPLTARATLDADSGVQAALVRITTDQEEYVIAEEDGAPSAVPFERSDNEQAL